jgi:hypothetical protein
MSTPANASAAKAKKPGPKESPYSDKQEAWLDAQAEDYVKKTGPWKQIQGITNGTDDSDLSSWVSSRWDQFRKAFKPDLDSLMERKGTKIPDEHRVRVQVFQSRLIHPYLIDFVHSYSALQPGFRTVRRS